VRDEAHRFGITQVRRKARSTVAKGPLDEVPGIGPKRRTQLVRAFGGLQGLRTASADDLVRMPGITREMADRIVEALAAP
ncbi:MAG: helix-hairpin-helix domain-containing protein, partial [Acidimicrobiia bacterium]|nr:helix-hairpin-helix domain-containing protein [Acidimicrobiia bacterium]